MHARQRLCKYLKAYRFRPLSSNSPDGRAFARGTCAMPNEPNLHLQHTEACLLQAGRPNWRDGLPILRGKRVTLRELEAADAPALFAVVTPEDVSRFISPPLSTIEGFERFIAWASEQRRAGLCACFGVTLTGIDAAIGIVQVRELELGSRTAKWGFAIGSAYWGTGVVQEGAELAVNFAFDTIGVRRLEAHRAVRNGRRQGALRKNGAAGEGPLRPSFLRNSEYLDELLWTILDQDRRQAKVIWGGTEPIQVELSRFSRTEDSVGRKA